MASINPRYHEQAQLIYQTGLAERTIDVATSLEQQGTNTKTVPELASLDFHGKELT